MRMLFNGAYAKNWVRISITNNKMSEKYMELKLDLPNECYFPGIREFQSSQHFEFFLWVVCKCPSFSIIFSIRQTSDLNQIQGHYCLFVLKRISIPSGLVLYRAYHLIWFRAYIHYRLHSILRSWALKSVASTVAPESL